MSEKTGECRCPKCECDSVASQALQGIIERMRNSEPAQRTTHEREVPGRRSAAEFIELRAAKAIPSDVGSGRVRLPLDNHLGLKPGDVVCIQGATGPLSSRGSTSATVWRARPEDANIGVARLDGVVRGNAKVALGQRVRIRKANPEPCSELILAPDLEGERFNDLTNHFRRFKLGKGVEGFARRGLNKRPMERGDLVFVPGLSLIGEPLPFRVKDTNPRGIVMVGPETSITIQHPEQKSGEIRSALQDDRDMDPVVEMLGLVLRELDFSQRQIMHIIDRQASKSRESDSNQSEKRMHGGE